MQFEWDEAKRRANLEKHGLDFLSVALIFDGRPYLEFRSDRLGELRRLRIAPLNDVMVAVVWTQRADAIVRLISARRARDGERREYRALFG